MYYFPKILKKMKPSSRKGCKLDKKSKVLGGCTLLNVTMGRYSYVGSNTSIFNADIGSFCSIAEDCMIGGGEHPIQFVSTSPVFHSGSNCLKINFATNEFKPFHRIAIGNDVWIGAKCLIKGGVTIYDGGVLGMGSVLTHDIPPYEIWAGNPAHFIRKRFDDETIEQLLQLKWWNMSDSQLMDCGNEMISPEKLIEWDKENSK